MPALEVETDAGAAELRRGGAVSDHRFRGLFDEHFAFVWRTLRRLGVREASLADASQRVFLALSGRLDDVEEGDERAFLFGTARRVAADYRRLRENTAAETADDIEDTRLPSAEELVDQKRARELLDRLLDTLSPDLREVLVLHEGDGLSQPEIAAVLGIPQGTAASRLRRAHEEFRAALRRYALCTKTGVMP
jgi:RNA polymerase sigma-70 factor (ECF subfamily)